jgi:hypothetical protein
LSESSANTVYSFIKTFPLMLAVEIRSVAPTSAGKHRLIFNRVIREPSAEPPGGALAPPL